MANGPLSVKGSPGPPPSFNEAYWSHIDFILAEAKKLGLYVAAFAWWGGDANTFFADPQTHNYDYGKTLGQRYKDEPHL